MLQNFQKEGCLRARLSNIAISHISLVKQGANGKEVIYKSTDKEPTYKKDIQIMKNDEERGVLYGIVYSPDDVDSQGDEASAKEIQKAAYSFMKNRNTINVDKDHDFINKDAYIAESWILRKGDEIFPNEKEGSWAVAVQLESEELKSAVKKGEIAGLSMAGVAKKEAIDEKNESLADALTKALKKVFTSEDKKNMNKDEKVQTSQQDVQRIYEELQNENKKLKEKNSSLEQRLSDIEMALKKSKQNHTLEQSKENKIDIFKGVL